MRCSDCGEEMVLVKIGEGRFVCPACASSGRDTDAARIAELERERDDWKALAEECNRDISEMDHQLECPGTLVGVALCGKCLSCVTRERDEAQKVLAFYRARMGKIVAAESALCLKTEGDVCRLTAAEITLEAERERARKASLAFARDADSVLDTNAPAVPADTVLTSNATKMSRVVDAACKVLERTNNGFPASRCDVEVIALRAAIASLDAEGESR